MLTLSLSVIILELALQLVSRLSTDVDTLLSPRPRAHTAVRPRWMPSPIHPDQDANGFRNPSVPETASIVALGDSNTYGWGVKADEAWPRQLERLSGQRVYSLAWGGFGPVHLLALLDRVLAFKPKLIILSFYTGNDFYDSYSFVYQDNQFPSLRSRDPQVIARLEAIENDPVQRTLEADVQAAIRDFHWITRGRRDPVPLEQLSAGRRFVSEHVKLWGVLRALRLLWNEHRQKSAVPFDYLNHEPSWEVLKQQARAKPDLFSIFDNGRLRTTFTLNYRIYGVDLRDPRIVEGQRIALEALRMMHSKSRAAGAKFLVMLLPTKELAFKEQVYNDTHDVPAAYRNFVDSEESVLRQLEEFLTRNGIDYFAVLPAIRDTLSMASQTYGMSQDSHLNSRGHRVIAQQALAQIESMIRTWDGPLPASLESGAGH